MAKAPTIERYVCLVLGDGTIVDSLNGLPTTGGGGGGGGAVTMASGAVASGAYSAGSIAAGAFVSGALVDGAITTLGALGDAAVGDASGSLNAHARQIAKLLGTTLSVNAAVPGTVSTANSSTTPLGGGAAFTGTGEDVSGYALIDVSVLADQVSAAGGLSLQFSSDGTHWDITQGVTVAASTGVSYTVCPCAKFFRVVYTNGASAQGTFRLQTVYRPVASVPTLAALQDVNAALSPTVIAQRVIADLAIQDPGSNLTNRVRSAAALVGGVAGGSHLGQAAAIYQTSDTKFYPWLGTSTAGGFVQGPVAAGVAIAGNPLLMGGSDGTHAQSLKLNSDGTPAVGGFTTTVSATLTRPANTTTYTANTAVANATSGATYITFSNCTRFSGGSGIISQVKMIDEANQTLIGNFELWVFDTTLGTVINDDANWAPTDADLVNLVAVIPLLTSYVGNNASGATGNVVFDSGLVNVPFKCNGSANLFAQLVVRNAYVPVSAEVFVIRLQLLQD